MLLALGQREVQGERGPCRTERMTHPAAQALCQLADDPQAPTRLDPSESRSVIGHSTVHPGTGTHQLDFDDAFAVVEAGMPERIRHQLVDGQRQAPAPLRFQRQRVDRQQKVDVHAVQLAPARGQAKLAKLFAGVDERVAVGHRQNAVDLDMLVKQIDDVAQLFLDLDVVCPDRLEGDKIDDGAELVLDPMVQLVQ